MLCSRSADDEKADTLKDLIQYCVTEGNRSATSSATCRCLLRSSSRCKPRREYSRRTEELPAARPGSPARAHSAGPTNVRRDDHGPDQRGTCTAAGRRDAAGPGACLEPVVPRAEHALRWLAILLVIYIVAVIAVEAAPAIRRDGLNFLTGKVWDRDQGPLGRSFPHVGQLYTSILALTITSSSPCAP